MSCASISTKVMPLTALMTMGKNEIKKAMMTFDICPVPNQSIQQRCDGVFRNRTECLRGAGRRRAIEFPSSPVRRQSGAPLVRLPRTPAGFPSVSRPCRGAELTAIPTVATKISAGDGNSQFGMAEIAVAACHPSTRSSNVMPAGVHSRRKRDCIPRRVQTSGPRLFWKEVIGERLGDGHLGLNTIALANDGFGQLRFRRRNEA